MRLLAHIEEIDKKKWKVSFDPDKQGAWGATSKLESKNKNLHQTKFDKKASIETITYTFTEIVAMDIIDKVNKAFRMYGYKTDMMPVPLQRDWHLSASNKGDYVHLTTSAFNKPVIPALGSGRQWEKWSLLQVKQNIINVLLGNRDTHAGNYVFDSKSQKNYAIDFGLAFSNSYAYSNVDDIAGDVKYHSDKKHLVKKYLRAQKYLIFWESFLEHNMNNFEDWVEDTTVKFLRKLDAEVRRVQKEYKYTELDLEELKGSVLSVKSDIQDYLKDNAQEILKNLKPELAKINEQLKNMTKNKK